MPKGNRNYINGRAKEYRVKKKLEKEGYTVLRTAGSHGFADLIAINIDKQLIRFVQCKPKKFSKLEEQRLMIDNFSFNAKWTWDTTFEVI